MLLKLIYLFPFIFFQCGCQKHKCTHVAQTVFLLNSTERRKRPQRLYEKRTENKPPGGFSPDYGFPLFYMIFTSSKFYSLGTYYYTIKRNEKEEDTNKNREKKVWIWQEERRPGRPSDCVAGGGLAQRMLASCSSSQLETEKGGNGC